MTEKKRTEEKQEKPAETAKVPKADENTVLIGRKPVMNYMIACLTFFNSSAKKVIVKARGRTISRAVDTVEFLRRVFMKDLKLQEISIDTDNIQRDEGQKPMSPRVKSQ